MPSEGDLARLLEDGLRRARIAYYHTRDSRGSAEGFPDYVIRTRPPIFAELKRDGGRLSAAQVEWLIELTNDDAGDAFAVVGVEGVLQLLRYASRRATNDRRPRGSTVIVLGGGGGLRVPPDPGRPIRYAVADASFDQDGGRGR